MQNTALYLANKKKINSILVETRIVSTFIPYNLCHDYVLRFPVNPSKHPSKHSSKPSSLFQCLDIYIYTHTHFT